MSDRFSAKQLFEFGEVAKRDGYVVLPQLFPADKLKRWRELFLPLLEAHIAREGHLQNRGPGRFYVTLPFDGAFADPEFHENDAILAVVEHLVGEEPVLCQLATDTPIAGSEYQDIHRDTPPLFPEAGIETPAFQLAVNFPLCDVTPENGPVEIAKGTHLMAKEEGLKKIQAGEIALEPVYMKLGDVMVRDVRGLHRGTPNRSGVPRPMVVIGYSRRWLFRPEVHIRVPKAVHAALSPRSRQLLRFNPVVDRLDEGSQESYQSFAY
jgi:ectoine hydroxylase-related dioxygenase (phytanoyl-CoA dioxygenase family)